MTKVLQKNKAIHLRKDGCSITDIAKLLRVSKSTASYWCREIILTEKQIERIAKKSEHHATHALLKAAETQRQKRLLATAQAEKIGMSDVGRLTQRDILMVGLGLYWGEGYKKGSQELGFTNSDPRMVIFYMKWLQRCYGIQKVDLIFRVTINDAHVFRIDDVLRFWSKTCDVPLTQFTKTSFVHATQKKLYTETKHFGTLRIKVRRGTNLRRRILGSISTLSD